MNDNMKNKKIQIIIKNKRKLTDKRQIMNQHDNDKNKETTYNTATNDVETIGKETVRESVNCIKGISVKFNSKESNIAYNTPTTITENKYINNELLASNQKYGADTSAKMIKNKQIKTKIHNKKQNKYTFKIIDALNKTFSVIKKSISSINSLLYMGTGLILIVVVTLFLGVFLSLSDNSVNGASFITLSDKVIGYNDVIVEYANEYDIEECVPLIKTIMMVESKELGDDPMDSTDYELNTLYPDGITDPEYSIKIDIQYLANCLDKANVNSSNDTEQIYLAIQGYDFKDNYIIWELDNFEGYSKTNAQIYYDQYLSSGDINYVNHVLQYIGFDFGTFRLTPNFDNTMAWGYNNPYSRSNLYGQCTWFAWGRFYELYGFDPGFTGDGWDCARDLVKAHPDKFELSTNPQIGSIYSCIGRNHVGIVVGWDGTYITIQEGNLDNQSNTFQEAKRDWHTVTYDINTFRIICDGVLFTVKK